MLATWATARVGRPKRPEATTSASQRTRLVTAEAGAHSSVRPLDEAISIRRSASATDEAIGFSE